MRELRVVLVGSLKKRGMVADLVREPLARDENPEECRSFHTSLDDATLELAVLDMGSEMEPEELELRAEQWAADLFLFVVDSLVLGRVRQVEGFALSLLPCVFVTMGVELEPRPGGIYVAYSREETFEDCRRALEHWALQAARDAMYTVLLAMRFAPKSCFRRLPAAVVRRVCEMVRDTWHEQAAPRKKVAMRQCYGLVLIGDGGCGKSALAIQLVSNHFVEEFDPTIEDSYRRQISVDGREVVLEILDTAGCEEFSAMRPYSMERGQGFLLCFSVVSRSSFRGCNYFLEELFRVKGRRKSVVVVVGLMTDRDNREVEHEEARAWAASFGFGYMEASSRTAVGVKECFFELVRAIDSFRAAPWKAALCVMAMRRFGCGSVWWGMPRDVAKLIAKRVRDEYYDQVVKAGPENVSDRLREIVRASLAALCLSSCRKTDGRRFGETVLRLSDEQI
jgi:GTPase KRas protein